MPARGRAAATSSCAPCLYTHRTGHASKHAVPASKRPLGAAEACGAKPEFASPFHRRLLDEKTRQGRGAAGGAGRGRLGGVPRGALPRHPGRLPDRAGQLHEGRLRRRVQLRQPHHGRVVPGRGRSNRDGPHGGPARWRRHVPQRLRDRRRRLRVLAHARRARAPRPGRQRGAGPAGPAGGGGGLHLLVAGAPPLSLLSLLLRYLPPPRLFPR